MSRKGELVKKAKPWLASFASKHKICTRNDALYKMTKTELIEAIYNKIMAAKIEQGVPIEDIPVNIETIIVKGIRKCIKSRTQLVCEGIK